MINNIYTIKVNILYEWYPIEQNDLNFPLHLLDLMTQKNWNVLFPKKKKKKHDFFFLQPKKSKEEKKIKIFGLLVTLFYILDFRFFEKRGFS